MIFPKDKSDLPFSQRPLSAPRVEVNRPEQGSQGPLWQEPRVLISTPDSRQVPALPATQPHAHVGRAHAPSTRTLGPLLCICDNPTSIGSYTNITYEYAYKTPNKIPVNQIQHHMKRITHHDQVRLSSRMQGWFNTQKLINVI